MCHWSRCLTTPFNGLEPLSSDTPVTLPLSSSSFVLSSHTKSTSQDDQDPDGFGSCFANHFAAFLAFRLVAKECKYGGEARISEFRCVTYGWLRGAGGNLNNIRATRRRPHRYYGTSSVLALIFLLVWLHSTRTSVAKLTGPDGNRGGR